MGREVKRVALDFDWPDHKVWKGYVNPYKFPCPEKDKTCFNGYTGARAWLESFVRLIMIAGEEPLRRENPNGHRPHPYLEQVANKPSFGLYPDHRVVPITDDMLELTVGLAGREPVFLGHDAIDSWKAVKKVIAAAGLDPETWGICPVCHGHCEDLALKAISDCWSGYEPPAGPGWQMWETTSEGSPISPVFETPEELAEWLGVSGASSFGSETLSVEVWLKFIKGPGWAPSAVGRRGSGLVSGVKAFLKGE